jgi:hypothetical protein
MKIPDDIVNKIKEIRIKCKKGIASKDEIKYCDKIYNKYGAEQYNAIISDKEIFDATNPNPFLNKEGYI